MLSAPSTLLQPSSTFMESLALERLHSAFAGLSIGLLTAWDQYTCKYNGIIRFIVTTTYVTVCHTLLSLLLIRGNLENPNFSTKNFWTMQAFITANDPNATNPIQQTMRLRDEPPPITQPTQRGSRKRKSPPSNATQADTQPPPPPPPQQQQPPPGHPPPPMHGLPPMIVHGIPPGAPLPPGYYHAADFTPGGLPPPPPHPEQPSPDGSGGAGRVLSNSKRAEQNRKAQRAFRERRDQHVKALESRSQLLDAALASADEANRRWEECRGLLDQLRVENAALRAALSQSSLLPPGTTLPPPPGSHLPPPLGQQPPPPPPEQQQQQPPQQEGPNGVQSEDPTSATETQSNELNNDSATDPSKDSKKE